MKVGDYIRTPYGIRKVINITKDDGYFKPRVKVIELDNIIDTNYKYSYTFYTDEKVIKKARHSSNIIDLIEVGDYVNGCYVDEILNADECYDDRKHFHLLKFNSYFRNEDIKSIVTKEQFESMEYKVKE